MQKSSKIKNLDTTVDRPSQVDLIIEGLKMKSRLSAKDKRRFAMNLGKLAARVDPDKPLRGAQQIIKRSKQEGIEEKRKRYFRFPNEDAPDTGRGGEYASNPATFVALAEAAGEELSKSPNQKIIDRHRKDAFKSLLRGSSFMPEFIPSNASDMDAKQVLEEYASTLATAIEQRTKIQDLWKILDNTPIKLERVSEEYEERSASPHGEVATVNPDLLQQQIFARFPCDKAYFAPGEEDYPTHSSNWYFPLIELGHLAWRTKVRVFRLPNEMQNSFTNFHTGSSITWDDGTITRDGTVSDADLNKLFIWLKTHNIEQTNFPELEPEIDGFGWEETWVSILFKVGLQVIRDDNDQVLVVLNCEHGFAKDGEDGLYFLIDHDEDILKRKEADAIKHQFGLAQLRTVIVESHKFSVVHSDFTEVDASDRPNVWAIMPGYWPDPWDFEEGEEECFIDKNDRKDLENILYSIGWTENEILAEILLGSALDNMSFYPSRSQMDPKSEIFRTGSLGASLLHNASKASKENKITDLLIERVALTANSGLEFYEAMLEEHRAAINQI